MAQISFEAALSSLRSNESRQNNGNDQSNSVTFFQLAGGQNAYVRIMHDSREDFEVLSMHEIPVGDGSRKINCLGANCPICSSSLSFYDRFRNEKNSHNLITKIYVKLLEYVKGSDGTVQAVPRVWERPISFARELANILDTYGPLSNLVIQVSRLGSGTDTRYQLMPVPADRFPESIYVKDNSVLEKWHALGTIVLNKTADECNEYLNTGNFPQKQTAQAAPQTQQPTAENAFMDFNTAGPEDHIEWSVDKPKSNPTPAPAPAPQQTAQRQPLPWEVPTQNPAPQPTVQQAAPRQPMPWEVGSNNTQTSGPRYY